MIFPEICDDGSKDSVGCNLTCNGTITGYNCLGGSPTSATVCSVICGDGKIISPETCDDNNTAINDGCSSTCSVETGYTCTTSNPSTCKPICGDGLVISPETCDD